MHVFTEYVSPACDVKLLSRMSVCTVVQAPCELYPLHEYLYIVG